MISIWHLLWIVPLSGIIGYATAAILTFASEERNEK
jgi:hypothetical protein